MVYTLFPKAIDVTKLKTVTNRTICEDGEYKVSQIIIGCHLVNTSLEVKIDKPRNSS